MQYSYERWANDRLRNTTESADPLPEVLPPEQEPSIQPFPFSDDLKELEAGLPFDLEEGMNTFRQYQEASFESFSDPAAPEMSGESSWDELARLVADHVLAYMMGNPVQHEMDILRGKLNEYYRDNQLMAEQVKHLLEENEALKVSVSACELELATFRNVVGNVYLKR